jgi:SSS family solute:Na+ symporter
MNKHHHYLKNCLKITVPKIDIMIDAALNTGALGAKIVLIGGVIMYLFSLLYLGPKITESALKEKDLVSTKYIKSLGIEDDVDTKKAFFESINITNVDDYMDKVKLAEAEAYPHFLHIMGILFVINVIIMLVVGLIKPKTDIYVPTTTDVIDTTPWKYAWAVGGLIVALVLSTYLIF